MASRADVARLKAANDDLVALTIRDLEKFWSYVDLSQPVVARNALLQYVPLLVQRYGEMAATTSADWYEEVRAKSGVTGRFAAIPAKTIAVEAIESEVRYAAGALFTDAPAGTLETLKGATARYVLNAGRDTIVGSTKSDPKAAGWYRVTSGGCDFCDMLASRGAVYSQRSVDFATHDHCRCSAAPSWSGGRPKADAQQVEASQRAVEPASAAKAGPSSDASPKPSTPTQSAAEMRAETARLRNEREALRSATLYGRARASGIPVVGE